MKKKLVVMLLVACFLIITGCYDGEYSSENLSSKTLGASSLASSQNESIVSTNEESISASQNSSKEETSSIQTAPSTSSLSVTSSAPSVTSTLQSATQSTVTQTPPATSKPVYVTPTGKRYHLDSDCGGKNSAPATLDTATSRGLTPCQKCAQ